MGAIDNTLYGIQKGVEDYGTDQRTRQAFATDQAIRNERLNQDKELFPLRKATAETALADTQAQSRENEQLRPMQRQNTQNQLDASTLTLKEQKEYAEAKAKAKKGRDTLSVGLQKFGTSKDPQAVMDAFIEFAPGAKGSTAVRNSDGSITLKDPNGEPTEFDGRSKWSDGTPMTPDEAFTTFVHRNLDPVTVLEKKLADKAEAGKEISKQNAIGTRMTAVEQVKGDNAVAKAGATGGSAGNKALDAQVNKALDGALKTKQLGGGNTMDQASENDAVLAPVIRTNAFAKAKAGMEPNQAVRESVEDARQTMDQTIKFANQFAADMVADKIDFRDEAQLKKAVEAKNPAAERYLALKQRTTKNLGLGAWGRVEMNTHIRPPKK